MNLIKGFLFAVIGLSIMITLISLLIPSRVMLARGVVINAPADKVFEQVMNLGSWRYWQPVFKEAPIQLQYNGDSTIAEWVTNGNKNKFVLDSVRTNAVYVSLQRKGENDVKNVLLILPLEDSSAVQVEWRAMSRLKWYPWEKFYGIFMDKMAGPGYDSALNSLKRYVEEK